jgi:hypothetical protein
LHSVHFLRKPYPYPVSVYNYFKGILLSTDAIFGGTPLLAEHFDSALAKSVFNDNDGRAISAIRKEVERRTLQWVKNASPKSILRLSRQMDALVVPILSPSGFRQFCCILCEQMPQALENMPNTKASVTALARAVHLSKFTNPKALDRILSALKNEGFTP